jgi:hypothetical protein
MNMTYLEKHIEAIKQPDPNVGEIFASLLDVLEEELGIEELRVWDNLAMAFGSYTIMIRGPETGYDQAEQAAQIMLKLHFQQSRDTQLKSSPMG